MNGLERITSRIEAAARSEIDAVLDAGQAEANRVVSGWRARIDGYTVAGKTGTAQMLINGAYSEKDYWSSFVGFVPAENPVFAMIVILDRPRGELTADGEHHKAHDGGGTAAPLFSKIASYVAQYLEIPIEVEGE